MLVSTKGRYAIRVMIDLAEQDPTEYIPLMDIAERQDISEKYLESIMSLLSKAGLVLSLRGKGGGYRLAESPDKCTVMSVLECTEGSMAPVACLENGAKDCPRMEGCKTVEMWSDLYKMIRTYFEGITIADLVDRGDRGDYVI